MNKTTSQNGNAIIMILIAVALFAALGVAFSNTSRTSSSFITDEEAKAYANQIIAYGNEVKSAVKRLQLRGCSDTEVEFDMPAGETPNPSSPTDKSCSVFNLNGGSLKYNLPAKSAFISLGTYNMSGWMAKIDSVGSNSNLEIIWSIWNIRKDVCKKINDALNVTNPGNEPPIDDNTPATWDTNWADGINDSLGINFGDDSPEIIGKKQFCYQDNSTNIYEYVIVLIAR